MRGGDIVYKLLNQHGLAHARAAEQADLAALRIGFEQVDDLDAGLENLGGGKLLLKARGRAVDLPPHDALGECRTAVNRFAEHIPHPPERDFADGYADAAARSRDRHTEREILAARQEHAAHRAVPDVGGDLHRAHLAAHRDGQRLFDLRQRAVKTGTVHHGPRDPHNLTCMHRQLPPSFLLFAPPAAAPLRPHSPR